MPVDVIGVLALKKGQIEAEQGESRHSFGGAVGRR